MDDRLVHGVQSRKNKALQVIYGISVKNMVTSMRLNVVFLILRAIFNGNFHPIENVQNNKNK